MPKPYEAVVVTAPTPDALADEVEKLLGQLDPSRRVVSISHSAHAPSETSVRAGLTAMFTALVVTAPLSGDA